MLLYKSVLHFIPFPRVELGKAQKKATRMTKADHSVHRGYFYS